jgi:hypothetical protein
VSTVLYCELIGLLVGEGKRMMNIADCQLAIADWAVAKKPFGNRQLEIGNRAAGTGSPSSLQLAKPQEAQCV